MPRAGLVESESTDEAQVEAAVEEFTKAGIKAHGIVGSATYGYAARELSGGRGSLHVPPVTLVWRAARRLSCRRPRPGIAR